MPNPYDSCWTTADEIRLLIDSLGSHHKGEAIPDKTVSSAISLARTSA